MQKRIKLPAWTRCLGIAFSAATLFPASGSAQPTAPPNQAVQVASPPAVSLLQEPENPSATLRLSLEDALQLSDKNNRDVLAARTRLIGSRADVERALSALLPTLNAQGKYTYNYPEISFDLRPLLQALKGSGSDVGTLGGLPSGPVLLQPANQLDAYISANLPLLVPSAYPALRGARASHRAEESQFAATVARLRQSVATAFYAIAGAEELVAARRHAIDLTRRSSDVSQARFSLGVLNRVEVTRAELAVTQAKQQLRESLDVRASAYRTLGTMLQLDPASFQLVFSSPQNLTPNESGEPRQLIDLALQQRPEIRSLEETVHAAAAHVSAADYKWAPTLSAFANVHLTNATAFGGRSDYYALGLQLDWQILDGFARDAQRHLAEAQRQEAALRLSQLRSTIADDVVNAQRALSTRQQSLISSEHAYQLAQETFQLVLGQYEAGLVTQIDLLSAQEQLVSAEVSLVQTRFDVALSLIGLRHVMGSALVSSPGAASG